MTPPRSPVPPRSPRKRRRGPIAAAIVALPLALLGGAGVASAGDFQLDVGAGGALSTWRGDGTGFGSLKIGYRFLDLIAPYFLVRIGYGAVDERLLTLVSLGAQLWGRLGPTRPYLRLGLVHQHEETMSAVSNDAFGALFGVGDGIRHRGGFEGAIGLDFPLKRVKKLEVHATLEGLVTGFPDERGPAVYGGALMGIGLNYAL